MSRTREIRSFDYVNHPYERVRDALGKDPLATFRAATNAASARAEAVAVALHVQVAGLEIGKEVVIRIQGTSEGPSPLFGTQATRIELEWQAAKNRGLFPLMHGTLSIYPLSAGETQLDFLGHYEPPLGPLGGAIDAIVGHRIAEASVHRFLTDVAAFLRTSLQNR